MHSVRLPSFVVSTEIVFGGAGERLVIRHDAGETPDPYVAGTLLAIRRVAEEPGLRRGLDTLLVRPPDGLVDGVAPTGSRGSDQPTARSNVTSSPSVPPGPMRPFTSAEVMVLSCHPCSACSLRIRSSFSPDILPPIIFSRSSRTLYS